MTTKQCLEELIKYMEEDGYIDKVKKAKLIATLYRDRGDSS